MPRAVLISVGELSLEPIKTLVERNGVTTATIAVSDTASLKNFDALTSKFSEQDLNAECLLVQATSGVEQSDLGFTGITTHLVYSSPETYLTQCLIANQANDNADVAIQHYIQQYRKHIQSALSALKQDSTLNLCFIDDVCANPASFLKAVFEIDSQETKAESPTNLVYQTMALSAAAVLVDNDELYELYDDALSVGQLFGEFSVHLSPDSDTFKRKATLLNQVAKAIQQKNQQISTLNQQAEESTAKLSEKETQFSQLSEQLKQQSAKAEVQSSELEKQKQALVKASEQLTAKKNECTTLQQTLNAKTNELGAKAREADEAKVALSDKEAQCNQLSEQLKQQSAKAEVQSSELEKQKQALVKASEQLTAKKNECTTLQQTLNAKTNELGAKAREADEAKVALSDKEAQCNQLTDQLKQQSAKSEEQSSELEKQKQALAIASEQLHAKDQECAALQQTLSAKTKELGDRAKEADENKAKLSEKEAQCNQLTQQLEEQKQEAKLSHLQVTQLKEELEAAVQKAEKLAPIEQALKASNEKALQLQTKLTSTEEEQNLLMLQITQLQEELETTVEKANKLEPIEQALKMSNEKASQLQTKLASKEEEQKLLMLQITQLQEELEVTVQKASKLESTEQALKASNEQVLELQQKLTTANEDAQLSTLQIAQLQEELERTFSECEAIKFKEQEATAELDKQLEVNKQLKTLQTENVHLTEHLSQLQKSLEKAELEKETLTNALSELQQTRSEHTGIDEMSNENLQNAELELELASLQISQLQEELEYYYLALQESERSQQQGLIHTTMSSHKIQTKVFDKVAASELSVTGKYEEGDYQDIHLTLHNVIFPNGKLVESVKAKLVNVAGNIGIEFRAKENKALFREFEDSSDEYGPYLRYFLTAPENLQAQQQKTVERLNASERLLVMGSINVIAELLQNTNIQTGIEVTSEQWRLWRKAATALSSHVDKLPNWLSFDSVQLREEFATDGYEHLWLVFNNVLVGNVWRNTLEFKLSANAVGMAKNGEFSDKINIEFRELADGSAPLMTWPPENADEYGPKLNIAIDNLTPLNDFANQDAQLITHLVNNFVSILEKLDADENEMSRSKGAWLSAIIALLTDEADESALSEPQAHNEELAQTQKQSQKIASRVYNTFTCDEVVSVGSYQHLVFTQKGNNTKIKLRAENINPETFDAEVYLELRDGTSNVIYNDSEFFGEDDYGPRVKIPAETLEALLLANEQDQFLWAVSVYQDIPKNVEHMEGIDELEKLLWKNILNRKAKSSS
jgi:chromosome segregation ATPase